MLILLLLMLVMLMLVLLLAGWQIAVGGGGRCGGGVWRAYTFRTCAYQAGTKLEPNGTNLETAWKKAWNQAVTKLNTSGTSVDPS